MNRNAWSEYLKKQRLQDLKSLAKQLGIYIKSNTKKSDCIDIILSNSSETLLSSNSFGFGAREKCSTNQKSQLSEVHVPQITKESSYINAVEINEHLYSLPGNNRDFGCSVCHQNISENNVNCDACNRQFHSRCVGFDIDKSELNSIHMMVFAEGISKKENKHDKINSIKFVCPFCRFLVIDPYNDIQKPLFFTTFYSYTAIHNIHPKYGNISFDNSSHLPHFISKYSFSPGPLLNNRVDTDDPNASDVMIYCLRLDRMDLNHEFPRVLSIKANNRIIQNIESPSYDHIRRDCPIYLKECLATNQLIAKQNINMTFSTINALLQDTESEVLLPIPTAPYIIGLFLTKPKSCDNIIEMILSENRLSLEASIVHFKMILENKTHGSYPNNQLHEESSDEIICLNNDQYLNILCPLTMDTIDIPGRGSFCTHINCFDIKAFIQINSTIKAFNTRWKCPLCFQIIRPSMLQVDSFVEMIISDSSIPKESNKILINSRIFDNFEQGGSMSIDHSLNSSRNIMNESLCIDSANLSKTENLIDEIKPSNKCIEYSLINGASRFSDYRDEIIDISDDDDENVVVDDNFTINEDELNLLLDHSKHIDMNTRGALHERAEEITLERYIEGLDNLDNRKKRKFSESQPSSHPEKTASNNSKTSISLRI
ncbi:SAP+PHD+MIZ domain-containing protein [Cryptosporidium canis]|uniref:SAP+PHD+MIZ domain-containing protein n=1 Tax=Cryptosporidium canis TaxID=195482 RepID=A0ABQ8P1Y1_9CRYT|nr:SAP+PHD+MIZ domain-containing protein [Cryptosporidium canis]KAJ1614011.1 SAP+PHD+MIZ domain-containing protein [Cryptosporidium canis]